MKEHAKDVRLILSYFWSFMCAIYIGYILVKFGGEKEILTLIIGLISGTILGGIFGVWFSATSIKKDATPPTTTTTDISASVTTESK